jgi:hypothetical protein
MKTYTVNTGKILLTQLGEEGILYNIDKNEYYTLNETLFAIARGFENKVSIEELVASLTENYDIAEKECRQELEKGIQILIDKQFLLANG